ncbi:unnamed protein product [Durusdinium trenchii]|uniref:Uncharacterized protein n=1 Tax=Durusdinium trenchii TaxID=1381693 RepID=A0ABP0L649_9DINO
MKVTAIKGLFFILAMLGVALQGCGCHEVAMNSCSTDVLTDMYANKIAPCAGAEASLKCIPDHGCCDLEGELNGVKMTYREMERYTIEALSQSGACNITNAC